MVSRLVWWLLLRVLQRALSCSLPACMAPERSDAVASCHYPKGLGQTATTPAFWDTNGLSRVRYWAGAPMHSSERATARCEYVTTTTGQR
jgi:hypothetical protein